MKLVALSVVFCLSMVMALPQYKIERRTDWIPPATTNNWPKINTLGGGSPQNGFVDIDVRQKIWQSPNKQHAIDLGSSYSQKWGDPQVNPRPNVGFGVGYTFTFPKKH